VLIAPRASSAIGVVALISKLPSRGEQARLPATTSRAAAAVPGGKAAVPAGFVPALPSSPPRDRGSPTLGLGKGAVGRWVRAGHGCGGAEGMGASAGGSAWVCPFKWSCLLSSFGTQPLSCLRLQRQRIKGLFYLNETLSPTSRWIPGCRWMPWCWRPSWTCPPCRGCSAGLGGGCWVPGRGVLVGDGCCLGGEVPGPEQEHGSTDGLESDGGWLRG